MTQTAPKKGERKEIIRNLQKKEKKYSLRSKINVGNLLYY
jgi:hypothetical protein